MWNLSYSVTVWRLNKLRCCQDWAPDTLIVLLSRDRFSRLRAALKQQICLNERSDSNRCNTCSRVDSAPAREIQETVKGESLFTHDRTSQLGLDVVRKAPPGPLRKTTAPLRWGPQAPPPPKPPRRHGCDCVLWHLEMTWHSLYEWTATTFSFRLRFHSTVTSTGDWYKPGELIINAVRFFIGCLNFYWKGFQLLLLQVPACLLQDFRALEILSAGDIRKWGQPQRT